MEWLNTNSAGITALATCAILLATVAYVFVNSWMHSEMRKTRIRNETPVLSLRLEKLASGFFDLVVENMSSNAAYDVVFLEFPKPELTGLSAESTPGFFQKGIKYMAPGQKYRTFFLNFPAVAELGKFPDVSIVYQLQDHAQRIHTHSVTFNLSALHNTITFGDGVEVHENLAAMQKELKTIRKLFKHFLENQ